MYNLFFKILILLIILSTVSILGLKPKMHKKVFIFDSSYTVVDDNIDSNNNVSIPEKEQITVTQNIISKKPDTKIEKKNFELPKNQVQKIVVSNKPEVKQIKTDSKKPVEQKQVIQKNLQEVKKVAEQPKKIIAQNIQKENSKTEVVKPQTQNIPIKPQETKVLTEKEEEIAWNIWRSNLQNQIMKDTKMPYIPKGTVFKFSFDVDKYGRISNIQTWSLNNSYTPYAIQYIAPVIRSYQGKEILDFPSGTQRINTKFQGGWKISDNAIYSTPNDYHDIEKVKK